MAEIFMPINLKIEKIIVENAHLIDGSGMPAEFREFLAHVEVYKITVKNWEKADSKENVSYSNYPVGFNKLIEDSYGKLKKTQAKMIGMQ
ncbi:hypothetical protein [Mesorhizobium loti]|uniref:Uncharacterized protein n=1 Tax=Mesorhizobium loti R88b TaxID=935548 RepID=A0A6M7WTN8_RHILI|nr:hypothetical protein [Mesorhizobium loti]QKD05427.1 hypothetical protein EB235_31345 [Mesorhizobium loti R88b]